MSNAPLCPSDYTLISFIVHPIIGTWDNLWACVPLEAAEDSAIGNATTTVNLPCYSLPNLLLSNLMDLSRNPVRPLSPTFSFEKASFRSSLNNDSRAYRNLAMELIFACQFFVQAHKQSLNSSIRLRNVLIAADDALKSAAEARNWISEKADRKFALVIQLLSDFEMDFPSKDPTSDPNIGEMATGEANMSDTSKSPSTILYSLKKSLHTKPLLVGNEWPKLTRVVKFHLLSFLPDACPIVVKQVLSDSSSLQEILWNFNRFKDKKQRLTLRQNPHFYAELPTSPEAYGDSIKIDPTEDFQHADEFYVLTDNPEPVYIMTDQVSRSFGNFWCPNIAIIFKDISGRLMGWRTVNASLMGTHCWFCKRLLVSTFPRTSGNRHGLQPIITQAYPFVGWECLIGCLPIPNSVDFGLCVCVGRAAPDSSLLVVPFPPTSEQAVYSVVYRTHVYMLDNDSLLQIFSHYRLIHENNWNLRYLWRNLAHVCRRWRYFLYDSSSHLDIYLLLTNDSPSIDTLSHLPLLPLVIDYSDRTETVARKDEGHIHLGLQRHDRVRRVFLQAPYSSLRIWLEPMNKLFPRLEDLSLLSTTVEETNLMLPETFQAPHLRRLSLHGINLPKRSSLLSSVIALSTLSLTHIGASFNIPPRHLVTQLQGLPRLEELSIGFVIPIPLPSSEEQVLLPISPVRLSALKQLTYRGMDDYIDNLVALINAPLLEQLSLIFFFDLTFSLVNLSEFIHRTERFRYLMAQVIFNKDGASIHCEQQSIAKLSLRINCEPLDWKIDSATQVCNALGKVLFAVEELTIDLNEDWMPSDRENTLDSTMWHELLLPFVGVKKLHIGFLLTFELSQALDPVIGGLDSELLPELQKLEVRLEIDDAKKVFSALIETRESVGRPVDLLALPIPHAELVVPQRSADYGKQATSLVSIYRNFIQTEEQTFDLHNELKIASQAVDDALKSASEAGIETSTEADEKFKRAIQVLSYYEKTYHSKETVTRRMATETLMEPPTILNTLKEKLRARKLRVPDEPTMVVEFLLHRSLLDPSPIIVKQVLGPHSDVSEVLWNFSRCKDPKERLTLEQNPQFYIRLPTLAEAYGGEFRMDPIQTFQHERISVLTDTSSPGQVTFDAAGRKRVFGNVWALNDNIIFKDVCGTLEGESVVGAAIQGIPNLWCFVNRSDGLANSPNPTITQITSAAGVLIHDWKEPIRQMLRFPGANIRITYILLLSGVVSARPRPVGQAAIPYDS